MTYALLAALVLQPAAFLFLFDRVTVRNDRVVADLCQRLQAPETAVAQHVVGQTTYEPQHLPFDDDAAYLKYVEDMTRPVEYSAITSDDLG